MARKQSKLENKNARVSLTANHYVNTMTSNKRSDDRISFLEKIECELYFEII